MAKKPEPPILEGEIVDEKATKKKSTAKTPQRPIGPISERGLVIVVVFIIIAAGIYFSYPWLKDLLTGENAVDEEPQVAQVTEDPLTPLERLNRLEDRLTGLEDLARNQGDAAASEFSTLEDRLTALEQRTDALALSGGGAVDEEAAARIQALEREIEVLREALAQAGAFSGLPSTDFAQAVAQLAPPLYRSRPFEGELEQLRVLVLGLPALEQTTLSDPIATLSDYAANGIPSLNAIRATFNESAVEALKTEGLDEGAGWWDKTWARIQGLVVVRRTDETDTTTLEGILSQMEQHLEGGNLAAVLDALDTLPENAQKAFEVWRDLTEQREAAMEAYDTLVRFVPRGLGDLS